MAKSPQRSSAMPVTDPSNLNDPTLTTRYIQPFGVLWVLAIPDLCPLEVSQNAELIWGMPAEDLLTQPIAALFDVTTLQNIEHYLTREDQRAWHRIELGCLTAQNSLAYPGFIHRFQDYLILEIELLKETIEAHPSESFDFYETINRFLGKIQKATSLQETLELMVQEVRRVTGCDRLMAYRFQADGVGVVIAEDKREDWESFLELHFPPLDIPEEERQLYRENWLRMIVDANYCPVPILSRQTEPAIPDFKACLLRSVAPCHQEFLKNMGITAALNISLVDDAQLWGLMVGHHGQAKWIPDEIRRYCEFVGKIMSIELVKLEKQEAQQRGESIRQIQQQLQRGFQELRSLSSKALNQTLKVYTEPLLDLVNAQGAAVYFNQQLFLLGQTPPRQAVQQLLGWFIASSPADILSTHSLSTLYPEAIAFKEVASGLLAISIVLNQTSYHLLWFRPEVIRTVNWGGDPDLLPTGDVPRRSPRGSFALWKETVQATSHPWQLTEIEAAKELRTTLMLTALEFSHTDLIAEARKAAVASEAKSQFLAKMSHELRTPLNAILGFSQIMSQDQSLSAHNRQHLKIINNSGEHLLSLINDVLEMSKIEAGALTFTETAFNLQNLIQGIEEMLRLKAIAKNLQLIIDFAPETPRYIKTDENKLRQVVINLLGNAIKFTHQGSILLRVTPGQDKQQIIFEISDTGVGIGEEELEELFKPFGQATSGRLSLEGTGLGLSISQQFVQLMGGEITVASQLGRGSTFTFDIRVALEPEKAALENLASAQLPTLDPDQPHYRILIAEDVAENRLLLSNYLTSLGFEVQTVINGQEAIAQWQAWQPHLIWMDILMPVLDGYEATRKIRNLPQGQNVKIIALTANAFSEAQRMALEAGCNDYLAKPFRLESILDKLVQHLGIKIVSSTTESSTPPMANHPLLSVELLQIMPQTWLNQLHQAALALEEDTLALLITQIPPAQSDLRQSLNNLLLHFRFDLIVELTQTALK
ncbi:MAG: ATP-binding protein [Merismopediaceae bacterium]|nr:ATP-binding protein [Merismopediaceae bacterium]